MTYKTCVTLAESNPSKLNSLLKTTLKRSDYVEIRFDFMKPNKVPIALNLLKKMAKKMTQFSKNIKIVTTANSIKDTLNVLALYKSQKNTNLIAFAMGDYGRMSRILCTQLGSPYTYVSLGKPIAPGQFSLNEIKSMFKSR